MWTIRCLTVSVLICAALVLAGCGGGQEDATLEGEGKEVTLKDMINDIKHEGFNVDVSDMSRDDLEKGGAIEGVKIRDRGLTLYIIRTNQQATTWGLMEELMDTELLHMSTIDRTARTRVFYAYTTMEMFKTYIDRHDTLVRALTKSYNSRTEVGGDSDQGRSDSTDEMSSASNSERPVSPDSSSDEEAAAFGPAVHELSNAIAIEWTPDVSESAGWPESTQGEMGKVAIGSVLEEIVRQTIGNVASRVFGLVLGFFTEVPTVGDLPARVGLYLTADGVSAIDPTVYKGEVAYLAIVVETGVQYRRTPITVEISRPDGTRQELEIIGPDNGGFNGTYLVTLKEQLQFDLLGKHDVQVCFEDTCEGLAVAVSPLLWSSVMGDISVAGLAVTPDGSRIVAASDEGVVNYMDGEGEVLWSFETGSWQFGTLDISADGSRVVAAGLHEVFFLGGQGEVLWSFDISIWDSLRTVAITPEGSRVAFLTQAGDVYLLNAQGDLLWEFETGDDGDDLVMTPDSSFIAVGTSKGPSDSGRNRVMLLNAWGQRVWSYETRDGITDIAITPDGSRVVAGTWGREVYLLNKQGNLLWSFSAGGWINNVAITSDGSRVAVSSNDGNVYLFTGEGNLVWTFQTDDDAFRIAMTPDGSRLAVSSFPFIVLLDGDGEQIWSFGTSDYPVQQLVITPDGSTVTAGINGDDINLYHLMGTSVVYYGSSTLEPPVPPVAATAPEPLLWSFQTDGIIREVEITPDGSRVAVASGDSNVYLLNAQGQLLWSFKTGGEVWDLEMTPDGSRLAAGSRDGMVYMLDGGGQKLGSFGPDGVISKIDVTPDGLRVAVGTQEGNLYLLNGDLELLWRLDNGTELLYQDMTADGKIIVATDRENSVFFLDGQGNTQGSFRASGPVGDVVITPDGSRVAACSRDGNVYFLNSAGSLIWSFKTGACGQMAITPDGSFVTGGSFNPGPIRDFFYLLNREGELIRSFETGDSRADGWVNEVAITPDASRVVAGSFDTKVYLLDDQRDLIWAFEARGEVKEVAITPDGSRIVAGGLGHEVYLLDGESVMGVTSTSADQTTFESKRILTIWDPIDGPLTSAWMTRIQDHHVSLLYLFDAYLGDDGMDVALDSYDLVVIGAISDKFADALLFKTIADFGIPVLNGDSDLVELLGQGKDVFEGETFYGDSVHLDSSNHTLVEGFVGDVVTASESMYLNIIRGTGVVLATATDEDDSSRSGDVWTVQGNRIYFGFWADEEESNAEYWKFFDRSVDYLLGFNP